MVVVGMVGVFVALIASGNESAEVVRRYVLVLLANAFLGDLFNVFNS